MVSRDCRHSIFKLRPVALDHSGQTLNRLLLAALFDRFMFSANGNL